jgi:hypothetical protein
MLQSAQRRQVQGVLERAVRAFDRGELAAAERGFATAHRLDPRDPHALNGLGSVAAAEGRMAEAAAHFRAALALAPDLAMARRNLAGALLALAEQAGRDPSPGGVLPLLSEAAALAADAPELHHRLVAAAFALSDRLEAAGRGDCVEALRIACALAPAQPEIRINLENRLARFGRRAVLADYAPGLDPAALGRLLLVACFPKSGSTLLKTLLRRATGFPEQWLAYAYRENEHDIHLPHLLHSAPQDCVVQLHCAATAPNLHLMQAFGIRPIVLVRDIFDVLLSWKEFLDRGDVPSRYPAYDRLDEAARLDLVVDARAGWYIDFFAGWQRACRKGEVEATWLSYEALVADMAGRVAELLRFHRLPVDSAAIARIVAETAADRGATRFNKGVVGRGRAAFGAEQRARIARFAAYHPDVDFAPIGL